jgi:hypothetical protein
VPKKTQWYILGRLGVKIKPENDNKNVKFKDKTEVIIQR